MHILCLFISIFLLHHKKLGWAQDGRSDEGVKYFCQFMNISLWNLEKCSACLILKERLAWKIKFLPKRFFDPPSPNVLQSNF